MAANHRSYSSLSSSYISLSSLLQANYSSSALQQLQKGLKFPIKPPKSRPRRKKRQRKREQHNLVELTYSELDKLSSCLKPDRYKKKWVRLDLGHEQKQRVWKNGVFLTNNLFATRLTQKKGALLYHICFETKKHVMYARTDLGEKHCIECGADIPESAQTLLTLQKLK
jgi:hypothetical protein